jgi:HEAT repeat protein
MSKNSDKIEKLKSKRDIKGLISILKNGDYESRSRAAENLGALKATEAIPDLKLALEDPVKMVVVAAAKSLEVLSVDPETRLKIEKRLSELDRLEKNHQNRLQEVVASRGDPDIAGAKRIHEILSLGNARKQRVQENEKTNQTLLMVLSIVGLVAVVGWLIKFLFG